MSTPPLRRALTGVGAIFDRSEDGSRRYCGSCFSVVDPRVFVTAAHCIENVPKQRLWIYHFGGPAPDALTQVRAIYRVEEGDTAVLTTDAPGTWAHPFEAYQPAADFGEDVYAIGRTAENLPGETPNKPSLRCFRGVIQRPLGFTPPLGRRYSAYELSFPCPSGLSGGPVFLARDPSTVIGVVTANYDTYTLLDEEEEQPGQVVRTRRIVTYGVAANIAYAVEELRKILDKPFPNRLIDDNTE